MSHEQLPAAYYNILPLFVAIPLGAAFLMPILGKFFPKLPDILANLVNLVVFLLSLFAIGYPLTVYTVGGWSTASGIPFGIYMVLDGFSVLMLIIVNFVGLMATLFSIEYMKKFTDKTKYYTLFLLMMAGMNGVILSGDLFNLFVFLEVAAIASYALVAFGTEAEELEASFKYQVMGMVASAMILVGIAFLYSHTGTLNMADIARVIGGGAPNKLILFTGCIFIMGFGLKAAIMPFHAWLPDAHPSAPAPISAMLSGVLIKAVGVYTLCRILFNVIGIGSLETILYIIIILGSISMLCGALLAIGQRDIKRLLAYSSVSQIGFIIFSIGLGTPLGILGGLFHLLNHATFKSLLFLNSGAIVYSTGNRDLAKMGGLREKMPVTATTSLIASLSISGIPPFSGFWSKLIIIMAAVQAGRTGFAVFAVVVSIITLAYYLKLQKMAFYGNAGDSGKDVKEVPATMRFPMIVLAILCVIMGLLLLPYIKSGLLDQAVEVLKGGLKYSEHILGGM
jgi:multicomponent Na+:H+ antiporter subunit D